MYGIICFGSLRFVSTGREEQGLVGEMNAIDICPFNFKCQVGMEGILAGDGLVSINSNYVVHTARLAYDIVTKRRGLMNKLHFFSVV